MALNYLLHRHQVSLMRSEAAPTREARAAHRGLATGYAARIRELRADSGAAETANVT
jgi:hypothetical protein